ncbi:MAG: hypothetical protein Ta2A_18030 [Treponemataceae bacterium]|nr:hypothetical protein FACS189485_20840 [Spirochaetia bacterium]GHV24914.1 hypothetical protein AGMMS4952_01440 [Spirochaetia bacterium]GMO69739.1 MAG: hypothetical protein Ta2A_18030 [Treponemataceae bacterium]
MKCYCIEKDDKFVYCVENIEEKYIENIEHAWFKKDGNKYVKEYPNTLDDKEIIKYNFSTIGESMFKSEGSWKESLKFFAEKCLSENIEWYITGSISESVMGVEIVPHDIDAIIHTRDFYKTKEIFMDYLIEPFVDNHGTWLVQYFGRICINGVMFDIAADKKINQENHVYENIKWEGYTLKVESLNARYEIEKQRNRLDRIKAIEKYIIKT